MKRKLLLLCFIALFLSGCNHNPQNEEWPYSSIPQGSVLMDGNSEKILFLETDSATNQERLWVYEIATKEAQCFLTCHHHYGPGGCSGQDGMKWSRDSISDICQAQFVECGSNLVMVGEPADTYMNIYIVSDSDALYIGGANRYVGRLFNNRWFVTEYRTYGSYDINSILYYYDDKGKLMRTDTCLTNQY